ncbi:Stress-seventy subfamily A [Scheffersomyces stipitis CBS 6054]|uniref:Stress-seventy subfamily A n=1 Tax=Scheffersomyces stipitis (strain ATCC 58785 / CBS 6054 / NBRC 10063 / NRRL Y-11545) TaxID=322104 RepID=A3LSS8_PICST|nr:Stress-seventy subfamily A [Scheffersomyces stipitis CBS 6054]ABN66287.2 Stress-seventy subfamily A [Scheffersomyces stipitis CBS 6054]KAG2733079.1 hypothetical protein G9P44_004069 [Scheffersomyces stipitis]
MVHYSYRVYNDQKVEVDIKNNRSRTEKSDKKRGSAFTIEENNEITIIKVKYHGPDKDIINDGISSMIVRKLKADAESYLGRNIKDAIFISPNYLEEDQVLSIREAAAMADFKVTRIVNNTVIVDDLCSTKKNKDEAVMVFELGDGFGKNQSGVRRTFRKARKIFSSSSASTSEINSSFQRSDSATKKRTSIDDLQSRIDEIMRGEGSSKSRVQGIQIFASNVYKTEMCAGAWNVEDFINIGKTFGQNMMNLHVGIAEMQLEQVVQYLESLAESGDFKGEDRHRIIQVVSQTNKWLNENKSRNLPEDVYYIKLQELKQFRDSLIGKRNVFEDSVATGTDDDIPPPYTPI